MGIRLVWADNNLAEDGHRIYRSTSPMDPQNMPAPLATVGADVTTYDDGDGIVGGNTYYYRVGAFVGSVEKISAEISVEAVDAGVPTVGLFSLHTMDNITGSTLVDETGNMDGTISGATQSAGIIGQALDFTGGDHTVDFGIVSAIEQMSAITVSFWLYPTGTPDGYSTLVSNLKASDGSDDYRGFAFQQTSATGVRWFGFGSNQSNQSVTVTPDEWCHLVGIWTGTGLKLYKNGVKIGEQTLTINRIDSGQPLLLGKLPYAALYCSAKIDQLRIYDRELSESEILQLYGEV